MGFRIASALIDSSDGKFVIESFTSVTFGANEDLVNATPGNDHED
jgi:hypothetical protein